ncbi:MAG: hypothetical protein ACHP8A_10325 [Terriglobales bacterium]|jgi:hypothetical protein|nr:hypothetical protein [Terriglobales bacterium]
MRIISIRVAPVARILALTYAAFGFCGFVLFAFSSADVLTLPFGIVMPLFYLNANFKFERSSDLVYNIFLGLASVLLYALTGWITGAVVTICFNFVAKQVGGIDAKFVSTVNQDEVPK